MTTAFFLIAISLFVCVCGFVALLIYWFLKFIDWIEKRRSLWFLAALVVALSSTYADRAYARTGIASFYGGGERLNRHTASGQVFRSSAMAAAMRKPVPLGTRVRVTNLNNRKSVVVRVNDRGPASWTGALIDLTHGAFGKIADRKKGRVRVALQFLGGGR